MDLKTAFYMKLLFNRFHKGAQGPVLKLFPAGEEIIQKTTTPENDLSHAFKNPDLLLSQIHYSWVAEALSAVPEEKRSLYMAALPHLQQAQLKKHLQLEKEIPSLKGPLRTYIQREFLQTLLPKEHTPLPYVPKSSLQPLNDLSKAQLTELIGFLGLYDLAEEIKKIVDTKLLKNLYLALTAKQKEFLKLCIHQKETIQSPAFPLNDWSGDAKELEIRLHKRGLLRLAKALSGQNPTFIWTLTHALDTGRGKRLESMLSKEASPPLTDLMIAKVLQLIKFLEKE